nr:immunoglobulin light chain junction region [Mus musculus]NSM03512.1 immunoglobulin light chain junction region [Mus musculus]
CALWYSNHLVF